MTAPLAQLVAWQEEARAADLRASDAMMLATSTAGGVPSARMVFCRGVDAHGVRFFTNYESRKARELAASPFAAAVFFWHELGRQVRVEGSVERLSGAESDQYFASRPRAHQLGAWASPQSRPIAGIEEVTAARERLATAYAACDVPRPAFWGGYRIIATSVEFWQRGEHRLHQREVFRLAAGEWTRELLAP
jgi:pyridoxamine 5'-phosphate oxidase